MVSGVTADPLTPSQLEALTRVSTSMPPLHRLVIHVIPYTGITRSEFCHLRREWLEFRSDTTSGVSPEIEEEISEPDWILVRIPPESPCVGSLKITNRGKKAAVDFVERTESCFRCKPDDVWTPLSRSRERRIVVTDEEPVDALVWWFRQQDSMPFSGSKTINRYVDEAAEKAGISRKITVRDLRWTYAFRLISRDIELATVAELMGMASRYGLEPLCELTGKPTDWESRQFAVTEEDLLDEVRRVADELGYPPRLPDLADQSKYGVNTYWEHLGGIDEILEAAGFGAPEGYIRTEELLDEIRRVADELGYPPRARELEEHSSYSSKTFQQRFGSIEEVLEAAGFEAPEGVIRTEELLEEIRQVADELGYPPQIPELDEHGEYSDGTYIRRFGSLEEALEEAGLEPPEGDVPTEELLEEIRRVADELGYPPRLSQLHELSEFSRNAYFQRFGGIDDALEAAGFEPPAGNLRTEELLQEMRRLADELGHKPSKRDMRECGEYGGSTYYTRFDSWTDALAAAGLTDT